MMKGTTERHPTYTGLVLVPYTNGSSLYDIALLSVVVISTIQDKNKVGLLVVAWTRSPFSFSMRINVDTRPD